MTLHAGQVTPSGGDWLAAATIHIRAYRPGDEQEINHLFNHVFDQSRTLQEWRWKFQENPFAHDRGAHISLAEVEGKIVGQWAKLMVPIKYQDKVVLGAQAVDNLVHPDFRTGGRIQRELVGHQPALARAQGLAFAFGFPDEIGYLMGKWILNYRDLSPFPTLVRRFNWSQVPGGRRTRLSARIRELADSLRRDLYRTRLAWPGRQRIAVREVPIFDERTDPFWEAAKGSYAILGVRDRHYLNWRYVAKPSGGYTNLIGEREGAIVGYAVLKLQRVDGALVGLIVDYLTTDDEAVDTTLLRGILNWMWSKNVDYALCRMLREDRVYPALLRHGFREHTDFPPVPAVYYVFSEEIDEAYLKDPRHWHLTFGDSDGV